MDCYFSFPTNLIRVSALLRLIRHVAARNPTSPFIIGGRSSVSQTPAILANLSAKFIVCRIKVLPKHPMCFTRAGNVLPFCSHPCGGDSERRVIGAANRGSQGGFII